MKTIIASLLLAMSALSFAQQADKPYTPKWHHLDLQLAYGEFFVDLNSIVPPGKDGKFHFVLRVLLSNPSARNGKPVDNVMMLSEVNCKIRQTVIIADSALLGNDLVSTGTLTAVDELSEPDPDSAHGVVMMTVCGAKSDA